MPLYELGSTIGTGCSSVVVQGKPGQQRSDCRRDVSPSTAARRQHGLAVKVIRKGATEALGDVERSVMWEVHVLQQLNHNHIVRVMDVIEVVDATYIIMERVDGPELTDYLNTFPHGRLPTQVARRIFCHVLCALRHAHRHGFLHCDIKPDNVRLSEDCSHAVLTDWGYARKPGMRPEQYMCGTPAYASPEQLTGYCPDSVTGRRQLAAATDVWSLGVTFFEMLSGHLPFAADDYHALIKQVLGLQYQVPDWVSAEDASVLESMLHLAPSDRATIAELFELPCLVSTGALVIEDVKEGGLLEGRVVMNLQCGECSEGSDGTGFTRYAVSRRIPGSVRIKKVLWMLLYGALCAGAIWSHLQAPGTEVVKLHLQ